MTDNSYESLVFEGLKNSSKEEQQERYKTAYKEAIDNRRFEIELFWKRATYFSVLIGALAVGYTAASQKPLETKLVISGLSAIISLAWYMVNRGSKFWQENWEAHVDCLEPYVSGHIYKTVLRPKEPIRMLDLLSGYPFSVSKISTFSSLLIAFMWLAIFIYHAYQSLPFKLPFYISIGFVIVIFFIISICLLIGLCQSRTKHFPNKFKSGSTDIHAVRRDKVDP